jgi:hypothetical protein
MSTTRSTLAALVAVLACGCAATLPYAIAAGPLAGHPRDATTHSPYHSRELWATINVCSPKDAPDVVGVRGSMPGDGQAKDMMYMRFRLEYYETTSRRWVELGHGADSGMLPVGNAGSIRQYGRSFTLAAPSHAFQLRGLVSFEWLRGKRVEYSTQRITSAPHRSLAGANPSGFSAATCQIS